MGTQKAQPANMLPIQNIQVQKQTHNSNTKTKHKTITLEYTDRKTKQLQDYAKRKRRSAVRNATGLVNFRIRWGMVFHRKGGLMKKEKRQELIVEDGINNDIG